MARRGFDSCRRHGPCSVAGCGPDRCASIVRIGRGAPFPSCSRGSMSSVSWPTIGAAWDNDRGVRTYSPNPAPAGTDTPPPGLVSRAALFLAVIVAGASVYCSAESQDALGVTRLYSTSSGGKEWLSSWEKGARTFGGVDPGE